MPLEMVQKLPLVQNVAVGMLVGASTLSNVIPIFGVALDPHTVPCPIKRAGFDLQI